MVTETF